MPTKIVYKYGESELLIQRERTRSLSHDPRLVDVFGRKAGVQDNGEFGTVVLYDHLSAKGLKITGLPRINFINETRSGDSLHLPQVESITHFRHEQIG